MWDIIILHKHIALIRKKIMKIILIWKNPIRT
jgi:hypothetical protein